MEDEVKEIKEEEVVQEAKTYSQEEIDSLIKEKQGEWESKRAEEARLAKLTEDERKKELEQKYKDNLLKKEKDLTEKEIQLILVDTFAKEKMDLNLLNLISKDKYFNVEDKETVIKQDIATLKTTIDTLVNAKVEDFKKDYLKGQTPVITGNKETNKKLNPLDLILNKL